MNFFELYIGWTFAVCEFFYILLQKSKIKKLETRVDSLEKRITKKFELFIKETDEKNDRLSRKLANLKAGN